MTATLSAPIQCDAAISDLVLQAARAAMPANPGDWFLHAGVKNSPQLALLVALLDATQAVTKAIADNAWDDSQPVPADLAAGLAQQAQAIANEVISASQCPARREA